MLVNLTFEDPMLWVERHDSPDRPGWDGKTWREWAEEVRPAHLPVRYKGDQAERDTPPGIYMTSSGILSSYLGEGCSHQQVSEFPLSDFISHGRDVEERLQVLGQQFEDDTYRQDYGTADDLEQILDYYKRQIDDPDHMYVICVFLIDKVSGAGFRFHKNGPYIGTKHNIDEDGDTWLPECIEDCENLDTVVSFHLVEVTPNLPGAES